MGKIPRDFLRFDTTELEEPTREILHATDQWPYMPPAQGKHWVCTHEETKEETAIRLLVEEKNIRCNQSALVQSRMSAIPGTLTERYQEATDDILLEGPSYLIQPTVVLPHTVGEIQAKRREGVITRGRKIPLGDCEVQELAI